MQHLNGSKKLRDKYLRKSGQLWLDAGCGHHKTPGAVGMDRRQVDGIDVIHDLEDLPYPFPDALFDRVILSHVMEHLNPKYHVEIVDELWRILKVGGVLALAMPYAGSEGHWQDPTHIKPWNRDTAYYFDPSHASLLYDVYRPKPWKVEANSYHMTGNLEIVLRKLTDVDGKKIFATAQGK